MSDDPTSARGPGPRSHCAAAVSRHPEAGAAVGEVIGDVLDRIDPHPDLAMLFASQSWGRQLAEIGAAIRSLLAPEVMIGATTGTVIGGSGEVEAEPSLALFIAHVPGVRAARFTADGEVAVRGPAELDDRRSSVALVLGERSLPVESAARGLSGSCGAPVATCGLRAAGPGSLGLIDDGMVHRDGGVGIVLPSDVAAVHAIDFPVAPAPAADHGENGQDTEGPVGEPVHIEGSERAQGLVLLARPGAVVQDGGELDFESILERCSRSTSGLVGSPFAVRHPDDGAVGRPPVVALTFH